MKYNYNIGCQVIARILFLGLVLQSCSNSGIPNFQSREEQISRKVVGSQTFIKHQEESINSSSDAILTDEFDKDLRLISLTSSQEFIQAREQTDLFQVNERQKFLISSFSPYVPMHNPSSQFNGIKLEKDKFRSIQQLRKYAVKKQYLYQVKFSPQEKELLEINIITKQGQEVKVYKENGLLIAKMKEKVGGLSRKLKLPVYPQELNLAEVLLAQSFQVVLPEQARNGKGYLYVGSMGLLGGGNTNSIVKTMEELEREEEEIEMERLGSEKEEVVENEVDFDLGYFNLLPVEIHQQILSYLSLDAMLLARQVHPLFYKLTTGYDQIGLVGMNNKPQRTIHTDRWAINKLINLGGLIADKMPSFIFFSVAKTRKLGTRNVLALSASLWYTYG